MSPIRQHARVLTASLVGTTVEFYDFYVYATAAALVFGPLFFPAESPSAQLLFSLMSLSLAFVARPVGAIAFGHFGDRLGRKSTLVASLLLMGGSTLLIGFLPTYAFMDEFGIGWLAPLLLCILRFGQGFALGGEWGGAALLAVENAPPGWEARFGSAPQYGAPLGFIFANGLFLLIGLGLSDAQFTSWGWRIPFLFSAVLVMVGLWVRLRISETPAFAAASKHERPPALPVSDLLRGHAGPLLATAAGSIAAFALFYLSTAFVLGHMTTARGFSREEVLVVQLAANPLFIVGIAVSAIWADRTSSGLVLGAGAGLTIITGLVFGQVLGSGGLWSLFAMLSLALFAMGMVYGPLGSWMSRVFPVRVRYTGISIAFTGGGLIGGALAPIGAQALSASGGIAFTGLILCAAGLVTLAGVLLLRASVAPDPSTSSG